VSCPLCQAHRSAPSWLGALRHEGRDFPYVECVRCRSLYASPMPDAETLVRMYGPQYVPGVSDDHETIDDPKEPARVVAWLRRHTTGLFVDYGCGTGSLLSDAKRAGWSAIGVEFVPEVAAATSARTGALVADRTTLETVFRDTRADVLHLGDVIEHLTDPDAEMPRILGLIKPGGVLMAQGPLEANATLFTAILRIARQLRRARVSEMAPYHVMLATAAGQRAFFDRFGLTCLEFSMREVSWPAPARLRRRDLVRPRALGLFVLRRLSQALSALRPASWGNRYFYVGRVTEPPVSPMYKSI
jgi:SAM-dependent methyltransferase